VNLFIVTGASRGLGWSVAKLLLEEGHAVVGVARSEIPTPAPGPGPWVALQKDLARTEELDAMMREVFQRLIPDRFQAIHLVNNAAVIEPVGFAAGNQPEKIKANIDINLTAPMILCSSFLRHLDAFKGWLTITNVSSGVAERPLVSWSAYSTAKAGLKLYSHALAQEVAQEAAPARKLKVVSFSPGVMDTEMQATIRSQSLEAFPEVERFHELKRSGQLLAPDEVATTLIELLRHPEKIKKIDINVFDLM
jgi:benzil reductase ((S)-benzoin forming)